MRTLAWTILRAFGGVAVAWAIASASSFAWVDVGGLLFLWVAAPLSAAVLGGLGERLLVRGGLEPSLRVAAAASLGALLLVAAGCRVTIAWNLVSGDHVLPSATNVSAMTAAGLLAAAQGPNPTLRQAAVAELGARHNEGVPALRSLIAIKRKEIGVSYVDDDDVLAAVRALSALHDEQVVSVLEDMLASRMCVSTISQSGVESCFYPRRTEADRILKQVYGRAIKESK